MTYRTLNGSIPWSAMTVYDEGRLGKVGCASSAPTAAEALAEAKAWTAAHAPRPQDLYMRPQTIVEVGGDNIFDPAFCLESIDACPAY